MKPKVTATGCTEPHGAVTPGARQHVGARGPGKRAAGTCSGQSGPGQESRLGGCLEGLKPASPSDQKGHLACHLGPGPSCGGAADWRHPASARPGSPLRPSWSEAACTPTAVLFLSHPSCGARGRRPRTPPRPSLLSGVSGLASSRGCFPCHLNAEQTPRARLCALPAFTPRPPQCLVRAQRSGLGVLLWVPRGLPLLLAGRAPSGPSDNSPGGLCSL